MFQTITVSFDPANEFEFRCPTDKVQALGREEASRWLHTEFDALECEPRNPMGKILLLDVIIDVAKYAGASRFAAQDGWGERFALCCAAALGRDGIRVDVPDMVIR